MNPIPGLMLNALGAALLATAIPAGPAVAAAPAASGEVLWLQTPLGREKAESFASPHLSAHPRLIIVLHGDAPFERPDYHYVFARRAAATLDDVVVVALLRPGYADPTGDRSDGVRGRTNGDNYTRPVIESLSSEITQLRSRYGARGTTLVGHSGGAALAALLMEEHPDLADRGLLVSCPCDVPAWRRHMARQQLSPIWLAPVRSLSPRAGAGMLSRGAELLLIVGELDDVAPVRFSDEFADAARRAKARVRVEIAPGVGHNILLEPAVMTALKALEDR